MKTNGNNDRHTANRRLLRYLLLATVAMFGFGYALVPLYRVFCEVTGIGGQTQVATAADVPVAPATERWVEVTFDANTDPALPWNFAPEQKKLRVKVGELNDAAYFAANRSDRPITARAVPSVAPGQAGLYFNKIECFCFTEQTLAAGEQQHMPVKFFIDPKLPAGIDIVTLSYTFFPHEAPPDGAPAAAHDGDEPAASTLSRNSTP